MAVPATAWEADFGSGQGRIASDTAPAGSYVYELGHADAGVYRTLKDGDYHQIAQTCTLTAGTKVLRVKARVRPPSSPGPCRWYLQLYVDGIVAAGVRIDRGAPRLVTDLAANVANLAAGPHTFALRLALTAPSGDWLVELPGCAVDDLIEDATDLAPGILNRTPEGYETQVAQNQFIQFDLVDTTGGTPDPLATTILVDDVVVFTAGAFTSGWATSSTYGAVAGLGTDVVQFLLVHDLDFASQSTPVVRVQSAVTGGPANALDDKWQFTVLDATSPTVVSAAALDETHVQVVFSEAVLEGDGTGFTDALNPGLYTFTLVDGAPAITPDPPAVAAALGTKSEPFALTPDGTLLVTADGVTVTATVDATVASLTSVGVEPFALADGDTLTFGVDGGAVQTLTLDAADFVDIANALAAEVAAVLVQFLATQGMAVDVSALTDLTLSSQRAGTSSSIHVTGGTANTALQFSTTAAYGTGAYANAGAATAAEVVAMLLTAGASAVVSSGAVQVQSVAVGPRASVQVGGTEADALGLSTKLTYGTSGVVAVAAGNTADTVVVELADVDALTNGATYQVAVGSVADTSGNVVVEPNNVAVLIPDTCPHVAGRDYQLKDRIPQVNWDLDDTGDLAKFVAVLQVAFDEKLCDVDRFPDITDPDIAPMPFVEAMLVDLGNPFEQLVLDDATKRKLVRLLVPLHQQKWTDQGIINAIRLLTGVEVEITHPAYEGKWVLAESKLGITTVLGSSDLADIYSFDIISPVVLTDTQRAAMRAAVAYMRRAAKHLRFIVEPEAPPAEPDHWALGLSKLGVQTILHAP